MATYVFPLPLLAAADVVLLAAAELELALELLPELPQAAISIAAPAARAAKRRRVLKVLMWFLLSLVLRRRGDRDPQRLQLTRVAWV
jgi:hypothetical protein